MSVLTTKTEARWTPEERAADAWLVHVEQRSDEAVHRSERIGGIKLTFCFAGAILARKTSYGLKRVEPSGIADKRSVGCS